MFRSDTLFESSDDLSDFEVFPTASQLAVTVAVRLQTRD